MDKRKNMMDSCVDHNKKPRMLEASSHLHAMPDEKWTLVLWLKENMCSVQSSRGIIDREMLNNPSKMGYVYYVTNEPRENWEKYEARVLATSWERESLESMASEFCRTNNIVFRGASSESGNFDNGASTLTDDTDSRQNCDLPSAIFPTIFQNYLQQLSSGSEDLLGQPSTSSEGLPLQPNTSSLSREDLEKLLMAHLYSHQSITLKLLKRIKKLEKIQSETSRELAALKQMLHGKAPTNDNELQKARDQLSKLLRNGPSLNSIESLHGSDSSAMARHLLKGIFPIEVLSNATVKPSKNSPRNPLDSQKLNVLKNYFALAHQLSEVKFNQIIGRKLKYFRQCATQGKLDETCDEPVELGPYEDPYESNEDGQILGNLSSGSSCEDD